jgi:hypothetical protein
MSNEFGWADLLANTPEGIVAGERAGGRALLADAKLPFKGLHSPELRASLEALGFQFGAECGGRSTDTGASMYIECKLPQGWRKGSDPNDYYGRSSYLFDEQGRKRASMFTKETSYDRYASITFLRRYTVKDLYVNKDGEEVEYRESTDIRVVLADGGVPFQKQSTVPRDGYKALETRHTEARAALLKLYPQADDPFAYWAD